MNKLILVGAAAVMLLVSASAFATANVTFVGLDKMTDVPHDFHKREDMQFALREHFNRLSEQLPAGQMLKVDVLDIDLAGEEFPRVSVQEIRVLKGQADWPRMHLRYSIEQDGRPVASGDSEIADPGYLMGSNRYSQEAYGYEKQMLDDWFRKEVLKRR